jgi:hypothetical protein
MVRYLRRWLFLCALVALHAPVGAQSPASPPTDQPSAAPSQPTAPNNPPTADDICRAVEEDAAANGLPVEFFARVIWQESRFNAQAVSPKGARGIAQFMPQTADWRGLADPFDPIEALKNSASYLHDLQTKFGNLGLAAAGYNAGPGRVSAWLAGRRALPSETRNYVAIITGWTADEWASPSPPQTAETTNRSCCAAAASGLAAPCATTSVSPTTIAAIWKSFATSSSPPAAPAWCCGMIEGELFSAPAKRGRGTTRSVVEGAQAAPLAQELRPSAPTGSLRSPPPPQAGEERCVTRSSHRAA